MRLLVCGGRDFDDFGLMRDVLTEFEGGHAGITTLIHGGARGADALAEAWATMRRIPCAAFPADWSRHGKAAGPIRNQQMLDEGKPDYAIAFPGGRGTDDMAERCIKAGVPLRRVAGA